jgi:protein TonB
VGLLLLVRSSGDCADALGHAKYSDLQQQIKQGNAREVLQLAQDALKRDPDSWQANALQSQALEELGRADEAEAGLIRWADRDRTDELRISALIEFYRRAERWESAVGLTTRIVALAEPERTDQLRSLVDTLCKAQKCQLAAAPVRLLIPGGADESREAVLRALDAASRKDVKGMLAELPAFPTSEASSAARAQAFILVSRRAAAAIRAKSGASTTSADLPPTGGASPDTIRPTLVTRVEPIYPNVAKRAGIEAKVVLRVLILPTGEVIVTGLYGASNPMFVDAAAEAVSQWRYEPGGEKPVGTDWVIRVDFRLRQPRKS